MAGSIADNGGGKLLEWKRWRSGSRPQAKVSYWRFRDPKWPPPLVTQSGGSIWPHLVPSFWVGFSSDFGIGDLASGFEQDSLA